MTDHPAADGTTEMPDFVRVGHGIGEISVPWRALLEAIPNLSPAQAEKIGIAAWPILSAKMKELTDELSAALSAQQSAERELAKAMPVVEAARAWREMYIKGFDGHGTARALIESLRALDAATEGGKTSARCIHCGCTRETGLHRVWDMDHEFEPAPPQPAGERLLCGECARPLHEPPCAPCTPDNPCGWGPPVCGVEPAPQQTEGGKLCAKCHSDHHLSVAYYDHDFEPAPPQTEGGEYSEATDEWPDAKTLHIKGLQNIALVRWRDVESMACALLRRNATINALRDQLAEAEKRLRKWVYNEGLAVNRQIAADAEALDCKQRCDRLERELATVAQKTAREQREACAESKGVPYERPEVLWFAEEMEKKLRDNDHKVHWSHCDFLYLDRRLDQEIIELKVARSCLNRGATEPVARVISEAADVANFAMMIADNARRLLAPPLVTDAPSKPECTHPAYYADGQTSVRCSNCSSREAIPTCKHGAPNCTAEHEGDAEPVPCNHVGAIKHHGGVWRCSRCGESGR